MGIVWSYVPWYWSTNSNSIKNEQDEDDYIDPVCDGNDDDDDDTTTLPFPDDIITALQLELSHNNNKIATQLLFQSCLECNLMKMKYIVNNYQPDVTLLYNLDRDYFRHKQLNFIDPSLKSLLHIASIHNSIKLIEYVINELGFKERNQINIEDHNGITPLALTTCCGNYHVMKYLITNYNANINIQLYRYQMNLGYDMYDNIKQPKQTYWVENLFYCALISNNIKIIEYVHKTTKIKNFDCWKYVRYEILEELEMKHASLIYLLQHPLQTLRVDSGVDDTLPHFAVRSCNTTLLNLLIRRGFKIDQPSIMHSKLSTPIFEAIRCSQWDLTKVLVEKYNVDVKIISRDRGSLLTELFKNQTATIEMCDYLINLGVDINGGTDPKFKCSNVLLSNNNYTIFNHLITQHNIIIDDWAALLSIWCDNMKCSIDDINMLEQHCPNFRQTLLSNEKNRQLILQKCTIDIIQLLLGIEHDIPLRSNFDNDVRSLCQNADPNVLDYFLSFTTLSTSSTSSRPIELTTTLEQLFTYSFDSSNHLVAKLLIEKYQFDPKTISYDDFIKSLFSNKLYINKELLFYLNNIGYFDFEVPVVYNKQTFPSFIHFVIHPDSHRKARSVFNIDDIKWLIQEKNINYHKLNDKQQTLLHLVQYRYIPNPSLIRYFIKLGINIKQRDNEHRTFVHYLGLHNDFYLAVEMMEMFLNLNLIDLNDQDIYGKTLLHHVMEHGMSAQVKILLYKIAEPTHLNICDNDGNTPIYYPIKVRNYYEIKLFVKAKNFDVNTIIQKGTNKTILHYVLSFQINDKQREAQFAELVGMILDAQIW